MDTCVAQRAFVIMEVEPGYEEDAMHTMAASPCVLMVDYVDNPARFVAVVGDETGERLLGTVLDFLAALDGSLRSVQYAPVMLPEPSYASDFALR